MNRAVVAILFTLLLAPAAGADTYRAADSGFPPHNWALDRVANSDCVIECTISGTHTETTTLKRLAWVGGDEKVGMFVADLKNVVVVRGYGMPRMVECTQKDLSRYAGQRMLLCCYWNPGIKIFAVGKQCVLHWLRDRWVETENIMGSPPERHISITPAELTKVVENNSLPSITTRSDVIVIGRVIAISDSTLPDYTRKKVEIAVTRVLKGDRHTKSVTILTGIWTPWFSEGQTWIAFLSRDQEIYQAVGDCNGVLKFQGQRVYYGRSLRCPYSRNMFVDHVRRLVAAQQRGVRLTSRKN